MGNDGGAADRTRLAFSLVLRDDSHEKPLLQMAEERMDQYLRQRPDVQPIEVHAPG